MDQAYGADRQRDRDTGTDQHSLPRFDDDILGGAQVHARVAVVGTRWHGDAGIKPQQRYGWKSAHDCASLTLGSVMTARVAVLINRSLRSLTLPEPTRTTSTSVN